MVLHSHVTGNVIDVIIPCHEKDIRMLDLAIDGIKKNGVGIRNVIVISDRPLTDKAEWFDQARYPFTKRDVAIALFKGKGKKAVDYCNQPNNRIGWVYQQLLKLYAPFVIPGIADNILALDADTAFLHPVSFIDDQGYALYNVGSENHTAYFLHAKRLLPEFYKVFHNYSGICHHMLFQRPVMQDLFNEIKKHHNNKEPWQALCHCADLKELPGACLSEYEIYFNYIFSHSYKVKIRLLKWGNMAFDPSKLPTWKTEGYHYVSCHAHMLCVWNKKAKSMDKIVMDDPFK